jgi:hypothetical protein
MKTIGMTVAQHQKLGRDLKDAEQAILDVCKGPHYGKSTKQDKALWKAMKALSDARCAMDDAVFREHPLLTNHELIAIYYGKDSVEVFA